MLNKISLSLFLGFIYLFISISLFSYGNNIIQYILFLSLPLPIFLAILNFPFLIGFIAFIPILFLFFIDSLHAVIVNSILTLPLLLIFLFAHIKYKNIGKYTHLIIIGYSVVIFSILNFYFNAPNFSLPDLILDTVHTVVLHINSLNPNIINEYNFKTLIKVFAFLLPTLIVLISYLILTVNYVIANYIINYNNPVRFQKFKIGISLPKSYIYIYIAFLLITVILHYTIKNNWNISYIMYNISLFLFIPFLIPGLGVVNDVVNKNVFFLFLFIVLIFISNLYLIVVLCLLGFLKEAKIIFHNNIK